MSAVISNGSVADVLTIVVVALILCGCAALIFWIVFGPDFETSPRGIRNGKRSGFYLEVMAFSVLAMLASSVLFVLSLRSGDHGSPRGSEVVAIAKLPAPPLPSPVETPEEPGSAPIDATKLSTPEPAPASAPPPVAATPSEPTVAESTPAVTSATTSAEPDVIAATPEPVAPAATASAEPAPKAATPATTGEIVDIAPASGTPPAAASAPASGAASGAPTLETAPAPAPEAAGSTGGTTPGESGSEAGTIPATPAPTETANAPPELATPAATPRGSEVGILMQRGDALRETGDFAAARLFYERAAEQGSAAAARAAGETYDPIVLGEAHARGVRGDARAAAGWYRKAIAGGDAEAQQMLQRLIAKYSG
ncbi:MAG TPA: hypothetical protein VLX09_23320 [Stellaceae bacterium]|nr:hypothetical protein [Stellaceae bacterium]